MKFLVINVFLVAPHLDPSGSRPDQEVTNVLLECKADVEVCDVVVNYELVLFSLLLSRL
jgi:hypothetical protein